MGANASLVALAAIPFRPAGVDEIIDDPDLAADVEFFDRPVLKIMGHRRDAVRFLDGEFDDPAERRVGPDQGDIRAVEGRDRLEPPVIEDLFGQIGAGRVGEGIMGMNDVEMMDLRQFDQFGGQPQLVGGELEQRIGRDFDLVNENVLMERAQTKGGRVADDMDLMAFLSQTDRQFRGDDPAPPVGRIANDADVHPKILSGA